MHFYQSPGGGVRATTTRGMYTEPKLKGPRKATESRSGFRNRRKIEVVRKVVQVFQLAGVLAEDAAFFVGAKGSGDCLVLWGGVLGLEKANQKNSLSIRKKNSKVMNKQNG